MEEKKLINNALFILFAEFLGYASPLIDWAEDICDCKDVPDFKKKIINLEADLIFSDMKTEYTIDEIKKWYNEFYPIILKDYDEKMNSNLH